MIPWYLYFATTSKSLPLSVNTDSVFLHLDFLKCTTWDFSLLSTSYHIIPRAFCNASPLYDRTTMSSAYKSIPSFSIPTCIILFYKSCLIIYIYTKECGEKCISFSYTFKAFKLIYVRRMFTFTAHYNVFKYYKFYLLHHTARVCTTLDFYQFGQMPFLHQWNMHK